MAETFKWDLESQWMLALGERILQRRKRAVLASPLGKAGIRFQDALENFSYGFTFVPRSIFSWLQGFSSEYKSVSNFSTDLEFKLRGIALSQKQSEALKAVREKSWARTIGTIAGIASLPLSAIWKWLPVLSGATLGYCLGLFNKKETQTITTNTEGKLEIVTNN